MHSVLYMFLVAGCFIQGIITEVLVLSKGMVSWFVQSKIYSKSNFLAMKLFVFFLTQFKKHLVEKRYNYFQWQASPLRHREAKRKSRTDQIINQDTKHVT